jgi:putative alpha-1,2-mannosidase
MKNPFQPLPLASGCAKLCLAGVTTCVIDSQMAVAADQPVDSVNIFIGTGGHGHTYPGATIPFGLVQLSPDTPMKGWDGCAGYHYSDSIILGFSHTHLSGIGIGNLGDLLIMPVTRSLEDSGKYRPLAAERLQSSFSHTNESAQPGCYRVLLDRYHWQTFAPYTPIPGIMNAYICIAF